MHVAFVLDMKLTPLRTEKITPYHKRLVEVLDAHLGKLGERSIVVVTSKIVAICEGRVVKIGEKEKMELIKEEAEWYLPPEENRYHITLTVKQNTLVPTAGIDESNGNGYYILWPANPQTTANEVRAYLHKRFGLKEVGIIITDSRTSPLRWGTTGIALAHSGFSALNNYIGKPDIFGRLLRITKANVVDALAVAAVLVMGEGNEQTPLAIIEDIPFVEFQSRDPLPEELDALKISLDDDLYAPLLKSVPWRKGGRG